MKLKEKLLELGFDRAIALDGAEVGITERTLIIAFWTYEMEAESAADEAWIHPYYRESHSAYKAARAFVDACRGEGLAVALRDDIRVKPIFARLPGLTQGRNTLSYMQGIGSRFYVKCFSADVDVPADVQLAETAHALHCGDCTRCMEACPTGAIAADGFHVERCIRFWMMPGKPVPEDVRRAMGNRLIGCDECQRCCPHNPHGTAAPAETIDLKRILCEPKAVAEELKEAIGVNLALPNRVLAQACMIAGCSGRRDLLHPLEKLHTHPSPVVSEHARWASEQIQNVAEEEP